MLRLSLSKLPHLFRTDNLCLSPSPSRNKIPTLKRNPSSPHNREIRSSLPKLSSLRSTLTLVGPQSPSKQRLPPPTSSRFLSSSQTGMRIPSLAVINSSRTHHSPPNPNNLHKPRGTNLPSKRHLRQALRPNKTQPQRWISFQTALAQARPNNSSPLNSPNSKISLPSLRRIRLVLPPSLPISSTILASPPPSSNLSLLKPQTWASASVTLILERLRRTPNNRPKKKRNPARSSSAPSSTKSSRSVTTGTNHNFNSTTSWTSGPASPKRITFASYSAHCPTSCGKAITGSECPWATSKTSTKLRARTVSTSWACTQIASSQQATPTRSTWRTGSSRR